MESFALTGSKWGNSTHGTSGGQVTWSFAAAGPASQFSFDAMISNAAFQQLIRQAYDTWEAVANIDFVEVADSSASMMRLGWDAIDGAFGTLGEAFFRSTSSDGVNFSIASAEIRFDTGENWSTDRNHTGGSQTNFYTTAVHEIGHAIGLAHVNDPTQIMNPLLTSQIELGTGDIAGVQTLYGQALVSASPATQGNDTFTLTTGNDTIDGLGGLDTAVFGAARSAITVTKTTANITAVGQGTDVLTNVERLQFSDGILAFDTDGNAGQAYRIYKAAFARTPDNDGLKFWINAMDGGTSLQNVATGFVGSAEFQSVYGTNQTNTSLVNKFYQNVLGRDGEAGGVAFWTGELNTGNRDVAGVLAGISESAENVAIVGATIDSGIFYA